MEPVPCIRRESRARRSSYAFSHREGYADLITQGTILRRSAGVNSDMLVDHTMPPDEPSGSMKESLWYPRKMSFLERKRHSHHGKVSSEDMQPPSEVSSSLTMDGQSAPRPHPLNKTWPSGSSQEKLPYSLESLPPTEMPLSTLESQSTSIESQMSLQSQPAYLPQEKTSLWKIRKLSWKNWPYIWQKEPEPHREGILPVSSSNLSAVMETVPPSAKGSSISEQPMEVEPSPVEREPSPMEWLPEPSGDQAAPDLAEQLP